MSRNTKDTPMIRPNTSNSLFPFNVEINPRIMRKMITTQVLFENNYTNGPCYRTEQPTPCVATT
jgi:hypothetical protein